jgi:hypothetical protein
MTNPAYEATNSDAEKLIALIKSSREEDSIPILLGHQFDHLIAELEQARRHAKKRDEENQDLMLTIGRLRVEREQLESAPNGMMQLSNELAEMKRKCVARPPEDFPDDAELLIEIEFLDDVSVDIKTAQWLKELRRRRAAGGTVEGE